MSRRRMFIFVTAIVLAVFILSVFLVFLSARRYVINDFTNQGYKIQSTMYSTDKFGTAEDLISAANAVQLNYPCVMAVFDQNENAIARRGSAIYIENKAVPIYLDNYLTKSMVNRIVALSTDDDKTISVRKATYCEKNGQLIPVKVTFYQTKYDAVNKDTSDDLTLTLTDNKATASVEPEPSMSHISFQYLDADKNARFRMQNMDYVALNYRFNESGEIRKEVKKAFKTDTTFSEGIIAGRGSSDQYTNLVTCNGKKCLFYYYGKIDTWKEAIYSNLFQTAFVYLIIFFAVVLVIALFIANKMYKKSRAQMVSRRAFTGAVAHEMKTPLAIIQNQCECLLENVAPEKHDEYINSILEESQRMNGFVKTFLQYNRLNSAQKVQKKECDLTATVNEELEKYRALFEGKKLQLTCNVAQGVTAKGTRELLSLAVGNYLSNAVRYTEAGGKVEVTLTAKRFSVYNDCQGLPQDERQRIWDVLYREDAMRSRTGNSTGMGLPICRRIFELLGCRYGCSNVDRGVEFYFSFS
jgi:hypothetical protein